MNKRVYIEKKLEDAIENYFSIHAYLDKKGGREDIKFTREAKWVKDSAVIENVFYKNGMWQINLLFAHYKDPLQFIIRKITSCASEKKATLAGYLFKKNAAKDQRGTLVINEKDFKFCEN